MAWAVALLAVCLQGFLGADRNKGGQTAPFLAMLFPVFSALFLEGPNNLGPVDEFEDRTVW